MGMRIGVPSLRIDDISPCQGEYHSVGWHAYCHMAVRPPYDHCRTAYRHGGGRQTHLLFGRLARPPDILLWLHYDLLIVRHVWPIATVLTDIERTKRA